MAIVLTEVASIHGSAQRMIFYRCTDSTGGTHKYGPVITSDSLFDAEAYKPVVAARVSEALAVAEFTDQAGVI